MRNSTWLWFGMALVVGAACEDSDTNGATSGTCIDCTGGNGGDGAGASGPGPGVGGSSTGGTGGNPSTGGTGGTGTGGGDGGNGGDGGGSGGGGPDTSCYDGLGCNPLVGNMCAGAGSACDVNGTASFECYDPPNPQTVGQACDDTTTCAHGLTCTSNICREYCCDGDDTPCSTGTCQAHPTLGPGSGSPIDIWVCLP